LLAAGLSLGAGTAVLQLRASFAADGIANGPWRTAEKVGTADASVATRAAGGIAPGCWRCPSARRSTSTRPRTAPGRKLMGRCRYRVTGGRLDARWWSLTLYDAQGYLIPNPARAHSLGSAALDADEAGAWQVDIARERQGPHWIAMPDDEAVRTDPARLSSVGKAARRAGHGNACRASSGWSAGHDALDRPLVVAVLAALAGWYATMALAPTVIMDRAWERLAAQSGINRMTHAPLVVAESQTIVRPSPDLPIRLCAFDLTEGPMRVHAHPVPGHSGRSPCSTGRPMPPLSRATVKPTVRRSTLCWRPRTKPRKAVSAGSTCPAPRGSRCCVCCSTMLPTSTP
jgi:hypothetical protein